MRSAWRSRKRISPRGFGHEVVDHHTYVLASDGDLMEGISQEAIALAGHLKLRKLIVLFDDNGISIDGPISLSDSVDQIKRFESAGWAASRVDGHDPAAIAAAHRACANLRPPDPDRLPHHHRLRCADQGRLGKIPRLAARRRRNQGRARTSGLDVAGVRDSRRRAGAVAQRRHPLGRSAHAGLEKAPGGDACRHCARNSSGASRATSVMTGSRPR